MVELSRQAGPYVMSEPELRAELAEAEAAGRLRCSLCGGSLQAEAATLVRRPLGHRWATLPVHPECAHHLPPASLPPAGLSVPVAAPQVAAGPGLAAGGATADVRPGRLGRLAGRQALAAAVLEHEDEEAALVTLDALRPPGQPPCGDFDPGHGPRVRAVHGLHPDLPVYLVPDLGVQARLPPGGVAGDFVEFVVRARGRTIPARAPAEGLEAFTQAARAGPCVVMLFAARTPAGPDRPVAALLSG